MKRLLATPILVALLAAAPACGGQPANGIASANGASASPASISKGRANTSQALVHFTECMSQHGQPIPGPDAQGNMDIQPPAGGDAAAWNTALRACQHYLPAGVTTGEPPNAQEMAQLRAFATCMRAHGIEMTDPDPSTGKSQFAGRLAHASKAQIFNDPQFKAANNACKNKLPKDRKEVDS